MNVQQLNINYVILAMVTGALLLASVYHTVLFAHNRLRLIGYYTTYLWGVFSYCILRCFYFDSVPYFYHIAPDETLQMLSFALYIRFTKVAMELDPAIDKLAYWFCKIAPAAIIVYLVCSYITDYLYDNHQIHGVVVVALYLGIRVFLLSVGFTGLVAVIKKRQNIYFKYIFYGILSLIVVGLVATLVEVLWKGNPYIDPLSVLVIGYNIDVFFFSAAISYKMRMETLEKEKASKRVLEQELELQKNTMERMAMAFKIKEEERSRIATELHDEIGSTLSSISILSDVIIRERNETSVQAMQHEIKSNSKLMMEKMDDIIWSLNPRNDSMEKMLLRIRQFAAPLFEAKNINYNFDYSSDLFDIPLPIEKRQQAYLIIKEGINNLVKHAGCSEATFGAKVTGNDLVFTIADNGKGFDTGTEFSGNGLFNMRQRAVNMGATIDFSSVPAVQTKITLVIKIV